MSLAPPQVPVIVLCGGRGIFVDDSGIRKSKPLVLVEGEPMFIHVMRGYVCAGFQKFILAASHQADAIEEQLILRYQGNREGINRIIATLHGKRCEVSVVSTGDETTTGERIKAVASHLESASVFSVTYSDTISMANLGDMLQFHKSHSRIATLLATRMPTRFRILGLRPGESLIRGFAERAVIQNDAINGGYYFFKREILDSPYLGDKDGIVLETSVLEQLVSDLQLEAFPFHGAWQHLDSERDLAQLSRIVAELKSLAQTTL